MQQTLEISAMCKRLLKCPRRQLQISSRLRELTSTSCVSYRGGKKHQSHSSHIYGGRLPDLTNHYSGIIPQLRFSECLLLPPHSSPSICFGLKIRGALGGGCVSFDQTKPPLSNMGYQPMNNAPWLDPLAHIKAETSQTRFKHVSWETWRNQLVLCPTSHIITWQVIAPWLLFELFFKDRGTPRAETFSHYGLGPAKNLCQYRKPILVARFGREWHFGQELETRPFSDGVLFILRVERKRKIHSPFVSIFLPSSNLF